MPGAGSNSINEFGFYTNYYTLPSQMHRMSCLNYGSKIIAGINVGFKLS